TPPVVRSNSLTFSARSTAATCCEIPDCVAFSRCAARVNDPSSQTAITARICRNGMFVTGPPKRSSLEKLMTEGRIYYLAFRSSQHRISANQQLGARMRRGGRYGSKFRHCRNGLAAAGQLGPYARVPHRARARDDEKARSGRPALHV